MVKKIISGGIAGIDAKIVEVETDISYGLPCMEMVGNLGSEVRDVTMVRLIQSIIKKSA